MNRRSSFACATVLTTTDAHVIDPAIGRDVTAEAEIGRIGVVISECAVSADAISSVSIGGVTAAAREPADADQPVTAWAYLSNRYDTATGIRTKNCPEDSADAGPIIKPILHRRCALRGCGIGVHPV